MKCYICESETEIWNLFNLNFISWFEHSKLPAARPTAKLACAKCVGFKEITNMVGFKGLEFSGDPISHRTGTLTVNCPSRG